MLLMRAGTPDGTRPPPGFTAPHWDVLAASWNSAARPATPTVTLGPATVTLGHDDLEEEEDTDPAKATQLDGHEFGWDNEHPKRQVQVDEFRIEWRPVSNGEFYEFWKGDGKGRVQLPASWVEIDGQPQVGSRSR